MEQQIRFCKTADGVRIAYSILGQGPALVLVQGWISHLQLQWEPPAAQPFLEKATRYHTLITYDRYGCGLSERNRTDFSPESELRVLEAVVDHLKLKRFALLGFSCGGSVAIAYAVKNPRRVTHLILYGACARGEAISTDEVKVGLKSLIRGHWGMGSKILADLFLPGVDEASNRWFTQLQREAATPEMAARLLDFSYDVNVVDLLPRVRVPTLVMHRRGDRVVPFKLGREMASLIPKARFVPLDGDLHILFFGDSDSILRSMAEFLGDPVDVAPAGPTGEKFVRKLTAILSADVKGYSRLMAEDEEETVRTLQAYRQMMTSSIRHHRGRVVDTAGDSVLAEFASVVDAVQCSR
jgi:pimeloyl-ACP methyl ester carboxylesterase